MLIMYINQEVPALNHIVSWSEYIQPQAVICFYTNKLHG